MLSQKHIFESTLLTIRKNIDTERDQKECFHDELEKFRDLCQVLEKQNQ